MKTSNRKEQIQISLCRSSRGISMTAMIIVAVLELAMLAYTVVNSELFGSLIWRYRAFYIFLLAVAVIYVVVSIYAQKDVEHRYGLMNIANPLCAVLFYGWSLVVTYSDFKVTGGVDATVFMTFSLVVPLAFYMSPWIYLFIVAVADAALVWIILTAAGSVGPIINAAVFFIFQIVLGFNYLRLRKNAAQRIVEEQENALIDVLTGCPNRRAYENQIKKLKEETLPVDLAYIAIDIDGLKEVNDRYGHEAGDRLIVGAARCIENSFGKAGETFRIGGDEFAVLAHANRQELEKHLSDYKAGTEAWAEENRLPLSASCGCARTDELTEEFSIAALARLADTKMYQEKARYYEMRGDDRRKYMPDAPESEEPVTAPEA